MERTKLFQRKGRESHWHWQRKGSRKRWKRWCEIIRTSEHIENSKSVLELRENRSPTHGLLGEPWQMATATESRTFKFSWKGKRCEGQVKQRWWKERKIPRCWSTCVESTAEFGCELSGTILHLRQKQAQRLARLTRLSVQRWICVRLR